MKEDEETGPGVSTVVKCAFQGLSNVYHIFIVCSFVLHIYPSILIKFVILSLPCSQSMASCFQTWFRHCSLGPSQKWTPILRPKIWVACLGILHSLRSHIVLTLPYFCEAFIEGSSAAGTSFDGSQACCTEPVYAKYLQRMRSTVPCCFRRGAGCALFILSFSIFFILFLSYLYISDFLFGESAPRAWTWWSNPSF